MVGKGHNYGLCKKCSKEHINGTLNKKHKKKSLQQHKKTWKKKMASGYIHPLINIPKSKERIRKQKKSHKKTINSTEWKETIDKKRIEKIKKYVNSDESKKNIRLKWKQKRENGYISSNRGCKFNGELCLNCNKIHPDQTGKNNVSNRPEVQIKLSNAWKVPGIEKRIRKIIKFCNIKPNKPELLLDSILQKHFPNEYKLNVLGDTIINRKVPDWINCNGQKKVILHNGIYWHLGKFQKDNPTWTKAKEEEKLNKPYNELGFKVCHIWEDEFKNEQKIIEKIKVFNK